MHKNIDDGFPCFLSKIKGSIEKIKEEGFEVIQLKRNDDREIQKGFNYGNSNELKEEATGIKYYKIYLLLFIDTYQRYKRVFSNNKTLM
ncbi:MAG: UDP-2,4-diacetamido-2,4,6-trideoxy-beta-L-altropyranose hydrolase [Thermosediminibacterales bacterium]|nr:UDP-2,4-diacetamido-2,4,6-trideoxy-beta-L-altropyranose hydrolase [Thermosediminibacterales bacterium]MDK2835615.1 UDP-2,4-diacetamido-2,4,6-trideoxy-beta-L-altropyranose hydrolase [Thermosediminibacterales bacterium]